MSSEDEEMSDHLGEEGGDEGYDNVQTDNKPAKPLLEEYREVREAEEAKHSGERAYLEQRLRTCLAQNPKLQIGKASATQELLANMTIDQLKFAVQSAEDQLGLSSTNALPKATLKVADKAMGFFGARLSEKAYEDLLLLSVIQRKLPALSWEWGDWIQGLMRFVEHLILPGQEEPTPVMIPVPEDGEKENSQ